MTYVYILNMTLALEVYIIKGVRNRMEGLHKMGNNEMVVISRTFLVGIKKWQKQVNQSNDFQKVMCNMYVCLSIPNMLDTY